MENKEKKARSRERARGAVIGAGVIQGLIAVFNVAAGARAQDPFSFVVFGLLSLGLAVFFVIFKHPAWGILNTFLYVIGRGLTMSAVLMAYMGAREGALLAGIVLGGAMAIALTAFFIYADYQAFKLLRPHFDGEESE